MLTWGDNNEHSRQAHVLHPPSPHHNCAGMSALVVHQQQALKRRPGVSMMSSPGEAQILQLPCLPQGAGALGQGVIRNVGRSDLLRDAACLPVLGHLCAAHCPGSWFLPAGEAGAEGYTCVPGGCEQVHGVLSGAQC